MAGTSSPDPAITPFESGMPRLVLHSANLSRATRARCGPLLTLPMAHHFRIPRPHHSNMGCQNWCCSRRTSRGAHGLGALRCRWASLLRSYTFGRNRTSDGNSGTDVTPPDDDHIQADHSRILGIKLNVLSHAVHRSTIGELAEYGSSIG
jgi:hypothetical protein